MPLLIFIKLNDDGTLTIHGEKMRYILDTAEDCLRLNDIDVEMKLMKHQLGMNYLLGTPITAQAGFQNVIIESDLDLLLTPSGQITLKTLAS